MNNYPPFQYADCEDARDIMVDVINLEAYRVDDQLKLAYTTQAGDVVVASISRQGDLEFKAVTTYSVEDGPRSRTEQQTYTSDSLWTLFDDLNSIAKV